MLHKVIDTQNYTLTKKYIYIYIYEIREAIYSMENAKSPGVDGMPIEFYKEFLETIKYDLQKTYNETLFDNRKTPKTNQAIITLIPKKR